MKNEKRLKQTIVLLIEGLDYTLDYLKNNLHDRPIKDTASIGKMRSDIVDYLDKATMILGTNWQEIETEHFWLDENNLELCNKHPEQKLYNGECNKCWDEYKEKMEKNEKC